MKYKVIFYDRVETLHLFETFRDVSDFCTRQHGRPVSIQVNDTYWSCDDIKTRVLITITEL